MTTPEEAMRRACARILPEPMSGCWLWVGVWNSKGYGSIWVMGKLRHVHRLAYEVLRGPIDADLELDHLCRVPCCVNPAHLEAVTGRDNTLRGVGTAAVHARKTHCLRGHIFDAKNTRIASDGARECRACYRIRQNARRARG